MGYLVVTVPPGESRWKLEEPSELQRVRRVIIRKLKAMGFACGLSFLHFFGEQSPEYHPHYNFFFKASYLTRKQLQSLKRNVLRALAEENPALKLAFAQALRALAKGNSDPFEKMMDFHYEYTRSPNRMIHWLKYVTKATFLDYGWNERLAVRLFGFHKAVVWGKKKDWNGGPGDREPLDGEVIANGPAWELPRRVKEALDKLEPEHLMARGLCPICKTPITWRKRGEENWIFRSWQLPYLGYKHVGGRYYSRPPPAPSPVTAVKELSERVEIPDHGWPLPASLA
jgi:hypothetical protein